MKENLRRETSALKKRVQSKTLFDGAREFVIIHNEEEYKLRITGNEKLILTK